MLEQQFLLFLINRKPIYDTVILVQVSGKSKKNDFQSVRACNIFSKNTGANLSLL